MSEPQRAVEAQTLACLEVWGGNEPVDRALRVPGLDVWVYAAPFENAAAGGDVHFVSSCGTGRIARLMVADVAGHGDAVAQTARTLRSLIRRFMNHIDQRRFVGAMNEQFAGLVQAGGFATAVVMTYFSPKSELSVCNAGHPPPLIYHHAKGEWRYLDVETSPASPPSSTPENIPLGILGDTAYEQFDIQLSPGDMILCHTDSLMESVCADGSLLGTQRLLEWVQSLPVAEPAQFIHLLLAELARQGVTLNDDVTLLLSRCAGKSPGVGFAPRLWAQLKFIGQVLTLRPNIPWPELSKRNLGGALSSGRSR